MALTDNHFQVFDLPVSFDIDKEDLAQRYLELQRTIHPDNFAGASAQERRIAQQKAAQINEAYQTLNDPLGRGIYLLELRGAPIHDETAMAMDEAFLFEQMELRETLAEIKQQAEPLAALNAFLNSMNRNMDSINSALSGQFAQDDINSARDGVRKLRFFQRLCEEALLLEEELV
ncbi:MAG: Fe-S protein assembly co-chaperone HscB [Gammaproteobacteria bacterium]|nr:Fe-S protein assembly co-chaperone HscB [Gammaproteobacteria bacterium]